MSRKRLIFLLLLGDTDDTTGRSSPSIASRLAEFVPAFAEIILVSVNDHGTTDDRVGPRQADETVRDINLCYTVSPSSHVAEIASVTSAFAIFRSAFSLRESLLESIFHMFRQPPTYRARTCPD